MSPVRTYRHRETFPPRTPNADSLTASGWSTRVDLGLPDRDVRPLTVSLGIVQAVPDHELVGDVEADVLHRHGALQRVRLAQQRDHLHRGGVAALQVPQ